MRCRHGMAVGLDAPSCVVGMKIKNVWPRHEFNSTHTLGEEDTHRLRKAPMSAQRNRTASRIGGPDGTRTRNLWIDKTKEAIQPTLAEVPSPSTFIGKTVPSREIPSTADNSILPKWGLPTGLSTPAAAACYAEGNSCYAPDDPATRELLDLWQHLEAAGRAAILTTARALTGRGKA